MVNKGWLYGLIIFLAQTCNPYYSANDSRNQYRNQDIGRLEIPDEAMELEEEIEIEAPRRLEEVPPPPPPPPRIKSAPEEEQIFKVVEEMPRFPGCEQKGMDKNKLRECSQEEMLKFIYSNLKYPEIAKQKAIEGRVILQFVVAKNGNVEDVKVLRQLESSTTAEAIRVVKMMPKWIPGKQRGRPVKVQYVLPITFELQKEMVIEEEPLVEPELEPMPVPMPEVAQPEQEAIFKVVEDMPRFPGCENQGLNKTEVKNCAQEKLLKFVYGNLKYPATARENGIEGRVILRWVVNSDGAISDIKVLRDPGAGCGGEATRIIKMMPKWIPGKQRGRAVPVQYTFPVQFKLDKK